MWKYGSKVIRENKGWTDDNGITHSRQWVIWSADEKAAAGLTEITPETPPDSRLYHWSQNSDGTLTSSAKNLDDVKLNLTGAVRSQQESLLNQTDWAVTRKSEKTTAIPANIVTWRDAIRDKATAMEDAIDGAADTAAMAALFVTWDGDGNKSGILYDWPVLGT